MNIRGNSHYYPVTSNLAMLLAQRFSAGSSFIVKREIESCREKYVYILFMTSDRAPTYYLYIDHISRKFSFLHETCFLCSNNEALNGGSYFAISKLSVNWIGKVLF